MCISKYGNSCDGKTASAEGRVSSEMRCSSLLTSLAHRSAVEAARTQVSVYGSSQAHHGVLQGIRGPMYAWTHGQELMRNCRRSIPHQSALQVRPGTSLM